MAVAARPSSAPATSPEADLHRGENLAPVGAIPGLPEPALSAARRDELIDELARQIVARRMEMPAIFMLEAHRPLSFVASQGLLMTAPLLGAFCGFDRVNAWAEMLEDRENLDRLIARIEHLANDRPSAAAAATTTTTTTTTNLADHPTQAGTP